MNSISPSPSYDVNDENIHGGESYDDNSVISFSIFISLSISPSTTYGLKCE